MSSTVQLHEAEIISYMKMCDKKESLVSDYELTPYPLWDGHEEEEGKDCMKFVRPMTRKIPVEERQWSDLPSEL